MEITKDIINGIKVTYIKTNKFKTVGCKMFFKSEVNNNITRRMLLLDNLLKSSKKYNTNEKLAEKLLDLYNLSISGNTTRYGNNIITSLGFSAINDKFIDDEVVIPSTLMFCELLLNPNINNNEFNKEEFDINYKRMEISLKTEKENPKSYGLNKISKKMSPNTAISKSKNLKELKTITAQNLVDEYYDFINNTEKELYIIGDIDYKKIAQIITRGFKNKKQDNINVITHKNINTKLKVYNETLNTSGSILFYGLKLVNLTKYERSIVAPIYNGILGVGGSSRCFDVIREKNSLAYFSYSKYNKDDALMCVVSGIDKKNYDKTLKLTNEVLDSMNDIKDEELNRVKTEIIASIKEAFDYKFSIIGLYYFKEYFDEPDNEELINKIKNVTKEDLYNLNKKIKRSVIYMLEGDK